MNGAESKPGMVIDHIAVVVRSIEQALPLWSEAFGYQPLTAPVVNTRQRVRVVFLGKAGSMVVKLVEPSDASSPVHGLAMRGGGLHHLCFRCEHLDDTLRHLQGQGMRILAPPEPGEAFGNEPIAFVYAGQGLNVEIMATDTKAGRLCADDGGP